MRMLQSMETIRVVDESGEDYLYPAEYFVSVELPRSVEKFPIASCLILAHDKRSTLFGAIIDYP
jgi:hypothetical protein